jgi:hypothetical protein
MVLVLAAFAGLQGGCVARAARLLSGKGDAMVLESDIPAPPGLESRHATGIDQQGDVLSGGRFTYRGSVPETDGYADELVGLYAERGWTLWRREVGPGHGRVLFRKDSRQVEVNYRSNPVDPAMGSATILVGAIPAGAPPQSPPGGQGRGPA